MSDAQYIIEMHSDPDFQSPYTFVYSDEELARSVQLCEIAGHIKEVIIVATGKTIPYEDLHQFAHSVRQ